MANPKPVVANLTRIRASADTTVGDAIQAITKYVSKNTTPTPGNRRAAPTAASHPIVPKLL
jgi:hypothetical protein